MKNKLFVNVVANVVLIAIVVVVATVVFGGGTTTVFSKNEYAPIYRGQGHNQVSLLVNVYGGNEYLQQMLTTLEQFDVKCTFFVGGCWVAKNPDILTKIVEKGHEVGNHGYFHKEHGKLNYEQNLQEIQACNKIVFEYVGVMPTLFAPPSGDFCDKTLQSANDENCKTIMWSRDTIDWRDKDSKLIFERATKNVADGEFVLMHPTECTAKALPDILQWYKENGYYVVTVSSNLA